MRTIATARILMPAVVRAPERRAHVAHRRSAGAVLHGRRQLRVPRRSAADDAESRRVDDDERLFDKLGLRLQARRGRHRECRRIIRSNGRVRRAWRTFARRTCIRDAAPPLGVDFSSNDYLGLSGHPRVKAAFAPASSAKAPAAPARGCCAASERSFAAVERRFAAFKGTERALFFSTGYLANLAVLTTLPEPGDVIFSDERNHASLIDGMRLSGPRAWSSRTTTRRALARLHRSRSLRGVRVRRHRVAVQHGRRRGAARGVRAICRATGAR